MIRGSRVSSSSLPAGAGLSPPIRRSTGLESRVAYFTDCYDEINGVGVTSREVVRFALRAERPFLLVHADRSFRAETIGPLRTLCLRRGPFSVRLEPDFLCDPLLFRHARLVMRELARFDAHVVHVNGPGDVGALGGILARRFGIPLVAVWHTNAHEYFESRIERWMESLPFPGPRRLPRLGRRIAERALLGFYGLADLILARTEDDAVWLARSTGRPTRVLGRGVDLHLFHPCRRSRNGREPLRLGYVGRLSPEKNLRSLVHLERRLRAAGVEDFRIVVVGEGVERPWLERQLARAEFTGILRGSELARAFADLDLFVFPSQTDTFGMAVLEAQASDVPAVVMARGGPRHVIRPGETGLVAANEDELANAVLHLIRNQAKRSSMASAARRWARSFSQTEAFEDLYQAYALVRRSGNVVF